MKITHTATNNGGFNPLILIILILTAYLLVGCSTKPEVQYLKQVTVLKIPSEHKVVNDIPPPPFTVEQAGKMTERQQLDLLYPYSDELLMLLGEQKKRVLSLRQWESDQLELFNKEPSRVK